MNDGGGVEETEAAMNACKRDSGSATQEEQGTNRERRDRMERERERMGGMWRDINGRTERSGVPTGVKTEGHTPTYICIIQTCLQSRQIIRCIGIYVFS